MVCQPQPLRLAEGLGQGQGVLAAAERLGREARHHSARAAKVRHVIARRRMAVELLACCAASSVRAMPCSQYVRAAA